MTQLRDWIQNSWIPCLIGSLKRTVQRTDSQKRVGLPITKANWLMLTTHEPTGCNTLFTLQAIDAKGQNKNTPKY